MAQKAKAQPARRKGNGELKWPFGPKNYLLFAIALIVIIIGYVSLGQGSITLAPILLIIGYCVLVPLAIWIKGKPANSVAESEQPTS